MKVSQTKGRAIPARLASESVAGRRSRKQANSPEPKTAPCGHSHCDEVCHVRYIGPVSSIRDHHIMHVARGVSHIWTAAIIAGLAVVLTGAVAYSSANAANQQHEDLRSAESTGLMLDKMQSLEDRLGVLDKEVQQISAKQAEAAAPATAETVFPAGRP